MWFVFLFLSPAMLGIKPRAMKILGTHYHRVTNPGTISKSNVVINQREENAILLTLYFWFLKIWEHPIFTY